MAKLGVTVVAVRLAATDVAAKLVAIVNREVWQDHYYGMNNNGHVYCNI